MKKIILLNEDELVGRWAEQRLGTVYIPGSARYIGFARPEKLIAAVKIDQYNGTNCLMHVAAEPGSNWCRPEFLRICFKYVFEQLQCNRVTGLVDETNVAARRLDEHLGFELEARLKNATPNGDLLVYVMWKEKCRWLRSNRNELGKGQDTSST